MKHKYKCVGCEEYFETTQKLIKPYRICPDCMKWKQDDLPKVKE